MLTLLDRISVSLHDRYLIEGELGQGGMATVFLATDRRHERHVAIKVLHPELSAVLGAERFLSEIKLTASLQHPHILPLFDSGVADGLVYYVMPFVDGETLRRRLERERQLSVSETVRLAGEIAGALQYAHERGVVHRDIKPENVLLQNGHAIVADFGIALAVQQAGGSRMTQTGMSLGTPQYMAPEQAMGERNVDARADVYALGAVTYEMLAGEPPFTGPTAQSIVAKVMTERSRRLSTVRDTVPLHVEAAVATALEKLPADRMPSARAFAEALQQPGAYTGTTPDRTSAANATHSSIVPRVGLIGLGTLLGLVVASLWMWQQNASPTAVAELPLRFEVLPPDSVALRLVCCGQLFAISSDGRWLVFQGTPQLKEFSDSGRVDHQLYLRDLTDLSVRALPGTRNARDLFFSPDNAELGFSVDRQLKRLKLAGGEPQTIATLPDGFDAGGSWSKDGTITFAVTGRMYRISVNGGSIDSLFATDSADLQLFGPVVVDQPRVLLYATARLSQKSRIMWRSLETGKTRFVTYGATPTYVAAQKALLVVRNDGSLMQYAFDIASGDTLGPPVRLATDIVLRSPIEAHAEYTASGNGTVVLVTRRRNQGSRGITLVDLHGAAPVLTQIMPGETTDFLEPHFSPDGRKVAVMAAGKAGELEPYVYDVARGTSVKLVAPGMSGSLGFSASSDSVVYRVGDRDIFITPIDGSGEPRKFLTLRNRTLTDFANAVWGPWIAFASPQSTGVGRTDIALAHRDSGGRSNVYAASPKWAEALPAISPDGKWIAYTNDELGSQHVYVGSFPKSAARYLISPTEGSVPQWSSDSRALHFASRDAVYTVSFTPGSGSSPPVIGTQKMLYRRDPWGAIGIAPDGRTIAFVDRVREGDPHALIVRVNALQAAQGR